MGSTPNYGLRFPDGTDTPLGAQQIRDLADDINAALTDVRERPGPPFGHFTIAGPLALANGASALLPLSVYVASAGYTLPDANTIRATRPGHHRMWIWCRSIRTGGDTGVPGAGSYNQLNVMSPAGTAFNGFWVNAFQASWLDTAGASMTAMTATPVRDVQFQIQNYSGVAMDYQGFIYITQIDDRP